MSDPITPAQADVVASPAKLVQVRFPVRNLNLWYYNSQFDLRPGDLVYVEGKMAGHLGQVTDLRPGPDVQPQGCQPILARVDTAVHGQFFLAGTHAVTFDPQILPGAKAASWFLAPEAGGDHYSSDSEIRPFPLADLGKMKISPGVAQRGHSYYLENRVKYLCVDDGQGYAIVNGSTPYEVKFQLLDGIIHNLFCTCPCNYNCKHEFAAMLQLLDTVTRLRLYYPDRYDPRGYFAAVSKGTLFSFALEGREQGSFTL